jgi:hypothetical protein
MPRNLVLALANRVEGRDAGFNDWYDNQHLADVLAVPGVTFANGSRSVQRSVQTPV